MKKKVISKNDLTLAVAGMFLLGVAYQFTPFGGPVHEFGHLVACWLTGVEGEITGLTNTSIVGPGNLLIAVSGFIMEAVVYTFLTIRFAMKGRIRLMAFALGTFPGTVIYIPRSSDFVNYLPEVAGVTGAEMLTGCALVFVVLAASLAAYIYFAGLKEWSNHVYHNAKGGRSFVAQRQRKQMETKGLRARKGVSGTEVGGRLAAERLAINRRERQRGVQERAPRGLAVPKDVYGQNRSVGRAAVTSSYADRPKVQPGSPYPAFGETSWNKKSAS